MTDALRIICVGLALIGAPATHAASLWEVFTDRCLDPYEHHALAIHAPLHAHPKNQMQAARTVFGPTREGYLMQLDAAPADGERACAVQDPAHNLGDEPDGFRTWRDNAILTRRYEEIARGVYLSVEWSEPRLRLETRFGAGGAQFTIIETDLES